MPPELARAPRVRMAVSDFSLWAAMRTLPDGPEVDGPPDADADLEYVAPDQDRVTAAVEAVLTDEPQRERDLQVAATARLSGIATFDQVQHACSTLLARRIAVRGGGGTWRRRIG